MNLFLLLTALISALTSNGSVVRLAAPIMAVTRVAEASSEVRRVSHGATTRPLAAVPRLTLAVAMVGSIFRLDSLAPLYLNRRRE